MDKALVEEKVTVPKQEYEFLKELYRTVKRQNFLLRIANVCKGDHIGSRPYRRYFFL